MKSITEIDISRLVECTVRRFITESIADDYYLMHKSGKRGDAMEMLKKSFKSKCPNTKVVGNDGMPLVVYHATNGTFNVFDKNMVGRSGRPDTKVGEAYFFTTSKLTGKMVADTNGDGTFNGKNSIIKSVFLDIEDMLEFNPAEWGDPDVINTEGLANLISNAKRMGKDGVVWRSKAMGDTYVAFSPSQIKLTDPFTYDDSGNLIPISERFDFTNDDMRY